MATTRRSTPEPERTPRRRATTPEARENQLVALAYDLAEQQIRQGTASAQVISHFLKAGAKREQLEQERIQRENQLLQAKAEELASRKNAEELYSKALEAMKSYNGQGSDDIED